MFDSNLGRSHGVEDIQAASIQVVVKGLIPGIVKLFLLVFIFLSVNLCGLMTFASFSEQHLLSKGDKGGCR